MRIIRKLLLIGCAFSFAACGAGDKEGHDEANGPTMRPGENCKSCHSFSVAGTVFGSLTAAASDGLAQAVVTLKDADGATVTLTSNSAGNFYTSKALKFPLTAQITLDGVTKAMTQPVTAGGCATCHSSSPSSGAPGYLYVGP